MNQLMQSYVSNNVTYYFFECPGCEEKHYITNTWAVRDIDTLPTVMPSIRVSYPINDDNGKLIQMNICHMFIRKGKIEFLRDCTHKLAGETVDMIPIPPRKE